MPRFSKQSTIGRIEQHLAFGKKNVFHFMALQSKAKHRLQLKH